MSKFNQWSPSRKAFIISLLFPVITIFYTALKAQQSGDLMAFQGLFVVVYPILGIIAGLASFALLYFFFRSNK